MKNLRLLVFCISVCIAGAGVTRGQDALNENVGTPPAWGPAGYSDVRYYYLPDMEAYYDIHSSNFIYLSNKKWVNQNSLPARYKNYNLYRGYKVPLQNYSGNYPFYFFKQHKVKYAKGYKGKPQKSIGRNNKQIRYFIKSENGNNNGNSNMKMNEVSENQGKKVHKGNGSY